MNLERRSHETLALGFVALFALSLVMYFLVRYNGVFSIVDVAVFTNAANSVVETGTVTSRRGTFSSNGCIRACTPAVRDAVWPPIDTGRGLLSDSRHV